MTTTTILALLTLAHLVAFVAAVAYLVRARRQDAAQLAAFLDAMARGYPGAPRVTEQPVAAVPPAPVSGVHAVPTGDAEASEDQRPTMEIAHGMDVWASDTGERASVEELTTVHVPVVEALPSLLSGGTKAALGRLANGATGQPRVADAPANVRRAKCGAS